MSDGCDNPGTTTVDVGFGREWPRVSRSASRTCGTALSLSRLPTDMPDSPPPSTRREEADLAVNPRWITIRNSDSCIRIATALACCSFLSPVHGSIPHAAMSETFYG